MTFTGRGAKGAADPVKIGLAHMQRCQELCRGVNPYTTSLNKPPDGAVAALPADALRRLDARPETAKELVYAWMKLGGDGLKNTTVYQRYTHAHSLLRAAINANTLQYIAPLAGREAAEELQLLVMSALEERATDFAILTGGRAA